jgi:hypothetical protein
VSRRRFDVRVIRPPAAVPARSRRCAAHARRSLKGAWSRAQRRRRALIALVEAMKQDAAP